MRIDTMQALSSLLRGRRQALGLSQSQVASAAGVSRKFVSEVEAGKDTAEVGRVLRLLSALTLDLDIGPQGVIEAASSHGVDDDQTPPPNGDAAAANSDGPDPMDLDALIADYLARDS